MEEKFYSLKRNPTFKLAWKGGVIVCDVFLATKPSLSKEGLGGL